MFAENYKKPQIYNFHTGDSFFISDHHWEDGFDVLTTETVQPAVIRELDTFVAFGNRSISITPKWNLRPDTSGVILT